MRYAAALLPLLLLAACGTKNGQLPHLEPPPWRDALERAMSSVAGIVVERAGGDSFGAAVVVDREGHLLTADHVVEGATRVTVLIRGEVTVMADVVASDPVGDLALIKCHGGLPYGLEPARAADEPPVIGEEIWSIGNPFGTSRIGGDVSVSAGVVSALGRTYLNRPTGRLYLDCIQHDAATNPGNSGGGLFNRRGELLGLNALITTMRDKAEDSGVAFALPAARALAAARVMADGRRVNHGWLGEVAWGQATEVNGSGRGRLRAVFGELLPGAPADAAGISAGDVLITIDGEHIYGLHQALVVVDAMEFGRKVKVVVNRGGKEREFTLIAGRREID